MTSMNQTRSSLNTKRLYLADNMCCSNSWPDMPVTIPSHSWCCPYFHYEVHPQKLRRTILYTFIYHETTIRKKRLNRTIPPWPHGLLRAWARTCRNNNLNVEYSAILTLYLRLFPPSARQNTSVRHYQYTRTTTRLIITHNSRLDFKRLIHHSTSSAYSLDWYRSHLQDLRQPGTNRKTYIASWIKPIESIIRAY